MVLCSCLLPEFAAMVPLLDIHSHKVLQPDGTRRIYNPVWPELPDEPANTWVSMGVHPWHLQPARWEHQLREVARLATDDKVKLIGECGLDRLRGPAMDIQREAFTHHVELAIQLAKPLIIHCVRAFDDLLPYGRRYAAKIPLIIHGFNRSPELGLQLMKHGFLLSFGAAILQKESGAAKLLQRIDQPFFLETDDSGRGIDEIYQQAAFLRNVSTDTLKDTIFAAWKKVRLF